MTQVERILMWANLVLFGHSWIWESKRSFAGEIRACINDLVRDFAEPIKVLKRKSAHKMGDEN